MSQIAAPDHDRPFPEIRDALLRKETWIWILAFLAALIVAVSWPFVWEFSLLCCFPVPLFFYGTVRSGVIHRPGMMKVCITLAVVHCVLLAGTLYLWRESPKSITGDFGFAFVVIECAIIGLLMRFVKPESSTRRANQSV